MPTEFDRLLDSLLRIRPHAGAGATDLTTVRALGLRDLRRPRDAAGAMAELPSHVLAILGEAPDPGALLSAAMAESIQRRGLVLQRRTAIDEADFAGVLPGSHAGAGAGRRFGPFIESGTEPVWFDLLLPLARMRIVLGGDPRPALLFTAARTARPPRPGRFRLTSRGGTVWVRADLLVAGAGANDYAGFAVLASAFEASAVPASIGADVVTFGSAPSESTLRLDLSSPAAPEQGRCTDVDLTAPSALLLTWHGSSLTLRLEGGRASGPNGIVLDFASSTDVRLEGRRLWFPATVSPNSIAMDKLSNAHVSFDGTARVDAGGWSIPLTVATDPTVLPEADGAAAWLVRLADAVTGTWSACTVDRYAHDGVRVLLGKGRYEVFGASRRAAHADDTHAFGLWLVDPSRKPLPLEIELAAQVPFAAGCHPSLGAYLRYEAATEPRFGMPIDARARIVALPKSPVHVLVYGAAGSASLVVAARGADFTWSGPGSHTTLVLENAYLAVLAAAFAGLNASLAAPGDAEGAPADSEDPASSASEEPGGSGAAGRTSRRLIRGSASLTFRLSAWIPTLPDPYVGNVDAPRPLFDRGPRERVTAVIEWDDGARALKFLGTLEQPTVTDKTASPTRSRPAPQMAGRSAEYGLVDAGRQTSHTHDPDSRTATLREQESAFHAIPRPEAVDGGFNVEVPARILGVMLLDVSTNRHQIGVSVPVSIRAAIAPPRFILDGMGTKTPLSAVHVFALPQVQWEPVYTLDKDQNPDLGWFPTPIASPYDGGPTRIASRAQTLVPVIPDLVLEEAVVRFRDSRESMYIATTLPFGIVANLRLTPKSLVAVRHDTATFVRPQFATNPALEGALQLSIAGLRGGRGPDDEDQSFEGTTRQLLNGVDLKSGVPLDLSVLGATKEPKEDSVEWLFNREFATAAPRVPLTRYDISGYGASTFSDWNNPRAAFGDAAKVQFSIIVGRTAFEVVKINSKLYPWGISVTRSVTIERRAGGGVIRRDSGWQATSDGLFDFRDDAQNLVYAFEPGLIEGVFNVRRIRSTGAPVVALSDGGLVVPMYIDAMVQIAGGAERAQALGLLAFLHLSPFRDPITPADFAELVERHRNRVGGPVDMLTNVGGSGFHARATGIEVGVSRGAGDPAFVGAVRVAPIFPPVGSWAAVRGPAPSRPPTDVVAVDDGVPVLRAGRILAPANNAIVFAGTPGDFIFADTVDLHAGNNPQNDYGFLQATPTHRFLFRRPYIKESEDQVRSNLPPAVADILAASTSKGFFPPIDNAIPLTGVPYVLKVNPISGRLRLEPPVNAVAQLRQPLVVAADGPSEMRLEYGNSLVLKIDDTNWHFELPQMYAKCDGFGIKNLCVIGMGIIGGTTIRPRIQDVQGRLLREVEDVLAIIPDFGNRSAIGPIDLAPSNAELSTKVEALIRGKKELPPLHPIVVVELFAKLSIALESKNLSKGGDPGARALATAPVAPFIHLASGVDDIAIAYGIGFDLQVRIPVKPPPAFLAIGAKVEVGSKALLKAEHEPGETDEQHQGKLKQVVDNEITIYFGFGIEKDIKVWKSESLYAIGVRFIAEGPDRGIGGVLLFKFELSLRIVAIEASGEFAVIHVTKPGGHEVWKWEGELAVMLSYMFLSVEFSVELSEEDETPEHEG